MVIRVRGIEIDRNRKTIVYQNNSRSFYKNGDTFDRVCYFILGGGVSLEMAFYRFYGGDPEGGPLNGPQIFNTLLDQWQERFLNKLDLEWRSYKIAGVSFYEIIPKSALFDPKKFSFTRSRRRAGVPINSAGKQNV